MAPPTLLPFTGDKRVRFPFVAAYLDASFIIETRDNRGRKYGAASRCFADLVQQNVELKIAALAFDEVWCVYMRNSYRLRTGLSLSAAAYKADRGIWRDDWPAARVVTTAILAWDRLQHLESPADLAMQAFALMNTNPLAPRDAMHLALALHHRIPALVTVDGDFAGIDLPAGQAITIVHIT